MVGNALLHVDGPVVKVGGFYIRGHSGNVSVRRSEGIFSRR